MTSHPEARSFSPLFKFEQEYMEDIIKYIPMAVRFRLDGCGIKLKLKEWNQFMVTERHQLMESNFTTLEDLLTTENTFNTWSSIEPVRRLRCCPWKNIRRGR